jgi:hypothetical protein
MTKDATPSTLKKKVQHHRMGKEEHDVPENGAEMS